MRTALLVLGLALAVPAADAQPVFDWLTRADGMPSDYVLAVYPDRWGFIWFGTDAGAVRFDGRRLRTFSVDDGLPHAYVQGFAEAGDGTLWAATNGGLARRTASGWEPVDSPLGDLPVGRITADADGRLVATNPEALIRLEGDRWRVGRPDEGLGHKSTPLLELSGGRVLVSGFRQPFVVVLTPEGAGGFRAERWSVDGIETVPFGSYLSVYQTDRGLFGLLAERGRRIFSLRVDEARRRLVVASAPLPVVHVAKLAQRGGEVVGYDHLRLRALDLDTGEAGPVLLGAHVTSVAFDREGGLWAGTFGQGAARLRSIHLTSLTDVPARRLALAGDEAWATGGRAIVAVDLGARSSATTLALTGARGISLAGADRFRITAEASLWPAMSPDELLRLRSLRPIEAVAADPGWVSGTVETADTLWMGTYATGVRRFRKTPAGLVKVDTLGTDDGLPTVTVEDVARTRAGTWAITRSGLALLSGPRARAMDVAGGLPSSAVYSVYEAGDGVHWVGTNRGVARLDLGRWRAEAVGAEAMAGFPVVAFFERPAAPGVLWAVTSRALWRIEGGEARLVDGFSLVHDGRQTVEDAVYHAPSDRLVLATSAGVAVADLSAIPAAAPPAPPVAVVGATVDDEPVDLLGTPREARLSDLTPGRHRVVIEAAALRFGGAARVEWREPGDAWREAPGGRVTLPDVGAGAHVVEVRAVASGGAVSEEPARLAFVVTPRWWERRAVQVLLALVALAALVAAVRYVSQRRLRARVRELEVTEKVRAERERISRDLHDHVGAEVAAILTEAEVGRLEAASEGRDAAALREVEQRARRTMGSLREAVWALGHGALTPAALAARLGEFARVQSRHARLEVSAEAVGDTDRPLAPTRALALYRIGQEAVRNAVRHSGGSRLRVVVEATGGRVAVVVRDDGAFEPNGDGGGHGLGNMRARAEALGGSFALSNGDGTTVRAEIPLEA